MIEQLKRYHTESYRDSKDWQLLSRMESQLIDFDRMWTDSSALGLIEALEFLKAQVRSQKRRIEQKQRYSDSDINEGCHDR